MIETNMQQQQQDTISQQLSHPRSRSEAQTAEGAGPTTITCNICDAVYAPSPQQASFLQYAAGALDATFMGMCHFCFRCRRAACPQCWDEVHGVCGSCVQEAGLSFRVSATPLDGLIFPPSSQESFVSLQPQSSSLFVLVCNGRFYRDTPVKPEQAHPDLTTEHTSAIQPAAPTDTPDSHVADKHQGDARTSLNEAATMTVENHAADKDQIDTPATIAIAGKTPVLEGSQDIRRQEEATHIANKAKKASRLEQILTWIMLVIVLALIVVIALAEFIPAVNALVVRVTHIDIHEEIAYLVHIVQQLFKR